MLIHYLLHVYHVPPVALAVYNRSPSAYEALRGLHILQLPCSKVLKKVLKDGSEKAGIDHDFFAGQQEKYKAYQGQRESEGHPQPLGIGVMMWDEVKVGAKKCIVKLLKRC